jgi:hypothetical protein
VTTPQPTPAPAAGGAAGTAPALTEIDYPRLARQLADEQWAVPYLETDDPSPQDLEAAYQRAWGTAYGALTVLGLPPARAAAYADRAAADDEAETAPGPAALGLPGAVAGEPDRNSPDQYLLIAYRAAHEQRRPAGAADDPSPQDLEAAYQRAWGTAYGALTALGLPPAQAAAYADRAAAGSDDKAEVPPGPAALARAQLAAAVNRARRDLTRHRAEAIRASAAARAALDACRADLDAYDSALGARRYQNLAAPADAFPGLRDTAARLSAAARHLQVLEALTADLAPASPGPRDAPGAVPAAREREEEDPRPLTPASHPRADVNDRPARGAAPGLLE